MRIHQTIPGLWGNTKNEYCFNIVDKTNRVKYFYMGLSSITFEEDLQEWAGVTEPTSKLVYKDKK